MIVTIDGRPYETVMDKHGVQRFRETPGLDDLLWTDTGISRGKDGPRHARPVSPEVRELAKTNSAVRWLVDNQPVDLNEMAWAFHANNAFSLLDYAEFNMHIGYSVSGWADLSTFQHMEIDNPMWSQP